MLGLANRQVNANQNHDAHSPRTCWEWPSSKGQEMTSVGEGVERPETLVHCWGVGAKGSGRCGKQDGYPQNMDNGAAV